MIQAKWNPKIIAVIAGIALLTALVVGIYQFGVQRTTAGYNSLLNGDIAVLMHAGKVRNAMLQARRDEKDFILRLDLKYLERHREDIESLKVEAAAIAGILRQTGKQSMVKEAVDIVKLADIYRENFVKLVAAQKEVGLNPGSGIQGDFREVAHRLQQVMPEHDVDNIYTAFWAMRRYEKDYIRFNSARNNLRFCRSVQSFYDLVSSSPYDAAARRRTLAALSQYQQAMQRFMAGVDADRGRQDQDSMSRAAKEIEIAINSVRVPGVMAMMLEIRKHEKDFMLRRDEKYAEKLHVVIAKLNAAFVGAGVLPKHIAEIKEQLASYTRSFDALVIKYDEIKAADIAMRKAVHQIEPLVDNIYQEALEGTARQNVSLMEGSRSLTLLAIITGIVVVLLAILVAFFLTRSTAGNIR